MSATVAKYDTAHGPRPTLLEVRHLSVRFPLVQHELVAVDDIDFTLIEGEILAIVGESGCGKSVTALSLLNLVGAPGKIDPRSEVVFDGKNLVLLNDKTLASIRGKDIAMIFQEPSASFNFLFKIGYQMSESLKIHEHMSKKDALKKVLDLLDKVAIPDPIRRVGDYPFQLSGGMLQRVMIAQALSCSPRLLIADEPTTALDVTIQAQILALIKTISVNYHTAVLFITHDLALIEGFADTVMIMYAGRILERGPVKGIHDRPLHPYTTDLLASIPRMGSFKDTHILYSIKGNVPALHDLPVGCKYAPRCSRVFDKCYAKEPALFKTGNQLVRCWLYEDKPEPAGDAHE